MDRRLALVVDDSRTARETLKRMLDKHNIAVDTLESAQAALDYLKEHTPDVIFMDHMMPGMDGFQAVEAIKGNPDTATIPIMMYTSKEGDLYVSQARALGAIGILPKQVEPAELFEVLNKLGLVRERRRRPAAGSRAVLMDEPPELALPAARGEIEEIAAQAAQAVSGARGTHDHLGELLESYHHEMVENVQSLRTALEARPALPATVVLIPLVVMLMLVPLLWIYHDGSSARAELGNAKRRISELVAAQQDFASIEHSETTTLRRELSLRDDRARQQARQIYDTITWAINQGGAYDPHEETFSDARLATVQELVSRLRVLGFRGTVQLESHLGEFCLDGDAGTGYDLAPADLPVTACALIGHPQQGLPALGERQSIAFASFLATSPLVNSGDIRLETGSFLFSRPRVPYPPESDTVTAGEWNRIATANNRVDVRLIPETE